MLLLNLKSYSSRFKQIAGWLVLAITALLFVYYLHGHPQIWTNIKNVSPAAAILILVLYCGVLLTNAAILYWSVQICERVIGRVEAMLLNSYSTLVNFFGPLQSGPGFRAIYLKKKHGVSIKTYGVATLLYYGSFGVLSLLMVSYGLSTWLAAIALVVFLITASLGSYYLSHRYPQFIKHPSQVSKIIAITALQILFTTTLYFVELRSVNHGVHFSQAFVYTGAANLALFVSLTPGAIGFRESFLLFSEKLHHIDTHTVLTASLIDRAVYFVFLGGLFLLTAGLHAKDKFKKPVQST